VSDTPSFLDRHHLLFRRLHSLSGIIPIGVFLCVHLLTNASIVWGNFLGEHGGVGEFNHDVEFIHRLAFLPLIEIFGLWIPIGFHALLGIAYALSGKSNLGTYNYQSNFRYTLQRLTGYLGVIFIFMHIASLRWGWTFGGLLPTFSEDAAASSTAIHFQDGSTLRVFIITAFYLVSVSGLAYHFANGLWTSAITWGLTVSEEAQKRWGYICATVGVVLVLTGIVAVIGFATLDIDNAKEIEAQIRGEEHASLVTNMPAMDVAKSKP